MIYRTPKTLMDRRGCVAEVEPTWLLDAGSIAGHSSILVCEMPAGKLLEIDVRERSPTLQIVDVLSSVGGRRGFPGKLFLPNSAEFHSVDVEVWCADIGIAIEYVPWTTISSVTNRFLRRLCTDIAALGPEPMISDCRRVAGALRKATEMTVPWMQAAADIRLARSAVRPTANIELARFRKDGLGSESSPAGRAISKGDEK